MIKEHTCPDGSKQWSKITKDKAASSAAALLFVCLTASQKTKSCGNPGYTQCVYSNLPVRLWWKK